MSNKILGDQMKKYGMAVIVLGLFCSIGFAAKRDFKAVDELLETMNVSGTLNKSIDQILKMQITQDPSLEPYRDILDNFYRKVLSWDVIKPKFINLYLESFTDEELREMAAFYRTPLGKKSLEKIPELTAKGAQIGMQQVKDHQKELTDAIEKRHKELEKQDRNKK